MPEDAISLFAKLCISEFELRNASDPPITTSDHNQRLAEWVLRALTNPYFPLAGQVLQQIQEARQFKQERKP